MAFLIMNDTVFDGVGGIQTEVVTGYNDLNHALQFIYDISLDFGVTPGDGAWSVAVPPETSYVESDVYYIQELEIQDGSF